MCNALLDALKQPFGWSDGVNRLYSTLAQDIVYKDPTRHCIFLDNHDLDRVYSIIGEDFNKYKMADNNYDAIVIGSGISGGWAAKELTEKGLKTIMLERGRNIEHIKDYVNANKAPWEYPHRGGRTQQMIADYPVLKRVRGRFTDVRMFARAERVFLSPKQEQI